MPTESATRRPRWRRRLLPFAALALAGCEAAVDIDLASTGYGDVSALPLMITGVNLLDEDGAEHELDAGHGEATDLAPYMDGDTTAIVRHASIANGRYTGLRLRLADSGSALYRRDGSAYPVDLASNLAFADLDLELDENGSGSRLAIVEPRFSLRLLASGHYALTPVLRVVHPDRAASVSGSVGADLVRSDACRQGRTPGTGVAVYAFIGANVTPRDYLRDAGGSPVAATDVQASDDGTSFHYDFPYLAAGRYTLALTCAADDEDPEADDGLVFLARDSVVLGENEAATVALAP